MRCLQARECVSGVEGHPRDATRAGESMHFTSQRLDLSRRVTQPFPFPSSLFSGEAAATSKMQALFVRQCNYGANAKEED